MRHRWSAADREQLTARGIPLEEAERQLELLGDPPAALELDRPCRVGDGIERLPKERHGALAARFDEAARAGEVTKVVPASGAATRMFKALLAYLADAEAAGGDPPPPEELAPLFTETERLPFAPELDRVLAERHPGGLAGCRERGEHRAIGEAIVDPERGLGLAELPKGLIPFHRYARETRTAFEEHLAEAVGYACDDEGLARLHLTVSPEHEAGFREHLAAVGPRHEEECGAGFEVGFSHQSPATDTLAADPAGGPFRLEDGSLLLRPGGHGALLGNLEAVAREAGGRIVLSLKNIDNVVPEERQHLVVRWKKILGGRLLELRDRVFDLLERLEAAGGPAGGQGEGSGGAAGLDALLDEAERFVREDLEAALPETGPGEREARRRALVERLDRPLRVAGVVANEGEPGGGPFWVRDPAGRLSRQIVERSQIDPDDAEQQEIFASSTHFNPVDLACSASDRHGRPYDLERFVDPDTVFISRKSHAGRPLDALERPGLWNGAMAGWNTVFVEAPIETFAPVKTVLDLLRPAHQPAQERVAIEAD